VLSSSCSLRGPGLKNDIRLLFHATHGLLSYLCRNPASSGIFLAADEAALVAADTDGYRFLYQVIDLWIL